MVESKYVLNRLIAGGTSGILIAVITYTTLPPTSVVIKEVSRYVPDIVPSSIISSYVRIALLLSGVIASLLMLIIGALLGALQECLTIRFIKIPLISALISGTVMALIFVVPNLVMGTSKAKVLINSLAVITYTVTFSFLSLGLREKAT